MELNTLRARKFIENNKEDLTLPKFAEGLKPAQGVAPNTAQPLSLEALTYKPQVQLPNTQQGGATDVNPNGAQAAAGAHPGFAIGAWLGGGVLSGINSVQGSGELLASAGTSDASFGGIGYTKQNSVAGNLLSEYDRNTKKAWLTNPAEALTRTLWGHNKQAKAISDANAVANAVNDFNMAGAATLFLQQRNLRKEGDYENQVLYAKNGKLPGFVNGFDGRARISNGEIYGHVDPFGNVLDIKKAGHGKDNKDTLVRNLGNNQREVDSAFVITNKGGWSDYVNAGGDVNVALQGMLSGMRAPGFKHGKMPGFAEGKWGNIIPSAIGSLASLGQILDASGQDLYAPNIYAGNPYEQSALNDLAGLRINEYPIMNRLNQQRAEADFAIDNSGGLGGGLRARIRSANLASTQRSIADALINIQNLNNQYTSQLASAKMNLGSQRAQRQQQANQYRSEMLARAHGARQQGIQTGISNLVAQIQNYYANDFKRRQFNETMDLYRLQQALDKARYDADMGLTSGVNRYYTPIVSLNQLKSYGGGIINPYTTKRYEDDLLRRGKLFNPRLR